jgi:hypothetical protein
MAVLMPNGRQQFFDAAGAPLVGGFVYTYEAGTNTPKDTFTDYTGGTPNANPVELDARGEATIFWSGSYKVVLKDADNATIWTQDNYISTDQLLAASTGASLIGWIRSGVGAVLRKISSIFEERVSLFDFMTDAERADVTARTAALDVTAAIQAAYTWAAANSCSRIHAPRGKYLIVGTVRVKPYVELLGEGSYTLFYQSSDVTTFAFNETTDGALGRNIKFRDLQISKATKTSTTGVYGIDLVGTTNNIWGAEIIGVTVSKHYDGVRIQRPILTKLSRSEFEDNYNDGLAIVGDGTSVTAENCWGRVNGGYGLRVLGNINYSNFDTFAADGNTLGGHFFGLDGGGLFPNAITINAPGAEDNTGDGLKIEDGENFVINSPYMYLNGGDGMEFSGARGVVVNGGKCLTNTGWQVRASTSGTPKTPSTIVLIGTSLSASGLGRISDTTVVSEILSPDSNVVRFARPLEGLTLMQNGVTVCQSSQDFVNLGVNSQTYHTITQTFTFANVSAAATSAVYQFPVQVPNKSYILDVVSNLTAEFSGGAVATCTFEFGDAGDPDGYVPATNVFTGAGTGYKVTTVAGRGAYLNSAGTPLRYPIFTGARTVQVTIRTTGANTNALTAGAMTLQLGIVTYA